MSGQEKLIDQLLLARAEGRHPLFASTSAPIKRDRQTELRKAGLFALEYRHDLSKDDEELDAWKDCLGELPVLFTSRSTAQGGKDDRAPRELHRLFSDAVRVFQGIDIELAMGDEAVTQSLALAREAGCTAVVSWHDHSGVFDRNRLEETLARCVEFGADAVKIAVQTDEAGKLGEVVGFLAAHANENLAVLGMGRYGALSRVLLPHLGSLFTFASIGEETAKGQLALEPTAGSIKALGALLDR